MFLEFLATRLGLWGSCAGQFQETEISMFEQQQPFANLRRIMASLLTMTIALGPSVTPAFASAAKSQTKQAAAATATPIQHLVVIFQENVSFDHYFGTYPNALNPKGEPKFRAAATTPTVNGLNNALLGNNPNLIIQRMAPVPPIHSGWIGRKR